MDLLTATKRIKNALSSKDYIGGLQHLHLKGGRIYATDGALTASAPIDERLEHVVPASEFEKALDIFGPDAEYKWSDETLTIKKGKKRMTIRLLPPDQVSLLEPVENVCQLPQDFIAGVKRVRPFLSDDASRPWALTAWLRPNNEGNGIWVATNNISVVEVLASQSSWRCVFDVQVPNFTLDFLIGREQRPIQIGVAENKVSFYFDDQTVVTSQLFVAKMPDMVYNIVNKETETPKEQFFHLTDDWKESYKQILQLSPEEIVFNSTTMSAGKKQANIEIDTGTVLPRDTAKTFSCWNPKFLTPVVDVATHVDFGAYPNPSYFFGLGIKGIVTSKVV